eukprot:COSAG04_NODE_5445_length_1617_cov_29.312253_1_plen_248_part_10
MDAVRRRERAAAAAEAREPEPQPRRPLLVLDLDGTMLSVHRTGAAQRQVEERRTRPPGPATFAVRDPHHFEVWLRPGCAEFLRDVRGAGWDLAVWTAAPAPYAQAMIAGIERHAPCDGLASSLRAVFSEHETEVSWQGHAVVKKPLGRIAAAAGVPLWRCLTVDDTPSTYSANPSNALPVTTFRAGAEDDTLPALAKFLCAAAEELDRGGVLDVRGWRDAPPRAAALLPEQGYRLGGGDQDGAEQEEE